MQNTAVNKKQAFCLITLFVMGTTLLLEGDTRPGQDSWISFLLAWAAGMLCVAMYCRILALFPGQNLYQILCTLLGKTFGKILVALYALYFFHLAVLVVNCFVDFVDLVALPNTPMFVVALLLLLLAGWLASLGEGQMGRGGVFLFMAAIASLVITLLMSIGDVDLQNLFPMGSTAPLLLADTAWTLLAFPFAETVIFLILLGKKTDGENSGSFKVFGGAVAFASILLLLDLLRDITVLGGNTFRLLNYPTYNAISIININDFIQRIEVLVSGTFLIGVFVKATICIYAAALGVRQLAPRLNPRIVMGVLVLAGALLAAFLFPTTMASLRYVFTYRIYAPVLQIGIPVILWILGEIRRKKSKKAA